MKSRVCLIGSGYISGVHAEVLSKSSSHSLTAVVDPNVEAARRLAQRWSIPSVYASVDEALAADQFDRAHVLVPPDRHRDVTLPLLRAGKSVLVEKPMAVSVGDCDSLLESVVPPSVLGVNQNFVHHPAFVRLRNCVDSRAFGGPRSIDVVYNVPLRQLTSRQFGHWMFRSPGNMLLEQAIHPLSQILALCGPVVRMQALAAPPEEISPGVRFVRSFTACLDCEQLPASLRFAVGQTFPVWQLRVVCNDGVLTADIMSNRCWTMGRTRWLEPIDNFLSGQRTAFEIARDSTKGLLDHGLSTLKWKGRSDGFFQSMAASIQAFHDAADNAASPSIDGRFGRALVETCERIRDQILSPERVSNPLPRPARMAGQHSEIAVIGGTGFIGRQVVSGLVEAGRTVAVLARNMTNLSATFESERVCLHHGDIRDSEAVERAIEGAESVINLAHGGGGESWEAIRAAMVGGVECVARACLSAGTKRLLHIGSIASLYLGPQLGPVTGSTPSDRHAERRAPYARAKAECEAILMQLHDRDRLPVCILRPGLVVGEGSSPFHSGLGFYNNEQHCIGWNRGLNPLPFVLVEDVAAAIVAVLHAPRVAGRCYNLVGDVRLTAREYVSALALALQRPLKFHPKIPAELFLEELGKWGIKNLAGRRAPAPSWRDIVSRGLKADFDCSDARNDLDWHPVSDRTVFIDRAIGVHARQP